MLGHPAVARLLLARGMAPGVRFGRTRAALHYAVRHRQCEVGLALLERRAGAGRATARSPAARPGLDSGLDPRLGPGRPRVDLGRPEAGRPQELSPRD